MNVRW